MFRRGMPVNPKLVGSVLVSVFLVALAFAFVSHAGLPGRHYRYATAAFDEVPASLRPGSDVRVDGVRIGQVKSVSYKGGEARVTFQLPGGTDVRRDATARIRNRSALGQKYVDMKLGTAAAGPLGGAVIDKSHTVSLVELDQVLDALDAPTRAALASAVRELGGGVGAHGGDLNDLIANSPDLLADLGTTSSALSDPKARLVAFLQAAERLGDRFTGRQAELEALVGHMGDTLAALAADGGQPLRSSLEQAPGTLQALTPALRDLAGAAASTGAAAHDLGPAAAALGAATPDLRAALRDIVPTLGAMPKVNGLAEPALGALATTLTDARPLAPALRRGINLLSLPLEVLAPYAAELDLAADGLRDTTAGTDAHGNFLRIVAILVGADNLSSVLPVSSPGLNRNAYPTPGQAKTDGSRFSPDRDGVQVTALRRPFRWLAARSPLQLGVAWFVIMAVAGYGLLHKSEILLRLHDGQTVRAEFASRYKLADTISKVELGGVRVGTITGLERGDDGGAVVTMKLERSVIGVLGSAPRAAIRPATLLGGPGLSAAVELTPGGTPGRFTGDRIPRERTSVPVELDRVLEVLSDQARAGLSTGAKGLATAVGTDAAGVNGQQQLSSLLADAPPALGPAGPVLDALNGENSFAGTPGTPGHDDLHRLVDDLGKVSAALTAHDGELEAIVDGSASVADTFGDRAKDAAATVAGMPGALEEAQRGLAALGSSLGKLEATAPGARPSVQRLTELLQHLTPVLAKGRPVLADLRPLAGEARPVVEQLTPTAALTREFLTDLDGPVIGRLTGPVATTVLSPYQDSPAKFYEELGYLTTGLAGILQYTDPNGAMLNFYAGFNGSSLSAPVNGPRLPVLSAGPARKALG